MAETPGHLGRSLYLRHVAGRSDGPPPRVDLQAEKRNGDFVRRLIAEAHVSAVHNVSDGGVLVALAEMAMASGIGAELDLAPNGVPPHAFLFGEDQARYVVTCPAAEADGIVRAAQAAGVAVARLGTTGGEALTLAGCGPIYVSELKSCHEGWLPHYMAGETTS